MAISDLPTPPFPEKITVSSAWPRVRRRAGRERNGWIGSCSGSVAGGATACATGTPGHSGLDAGPAVGGGSKAAVSSWKTGTELGKATSAGAGSVRVVVPVGTAPGSRSGHAVTPVGWTAGGCSGPFVACAGVAAEAGSVPAPVPLATAG